MPIAKIEIGGYKCFEKEVQFDEPKYVNLIIGKNNSGKSSFLSIIDHIYCGVDLSPNPSVSIYYSLEKKDISSLKIYNSNPGFGASLSQTDFSSRLKELVGKEIKINTSKRGTFVDNDIRHLLSNISTNYKLGLANQDNFRISNITYKPVVLQAERDVRPEPSTSMFVSSNGTGLTGFLLYHSTQTAGKRKLVKAILNDVNEFLKGEDHFTDLRVLHNGSTNVIYLENDKGEIPLNDMGSGLKTILLVSCIIEQAKEFPSDSIFMFEELENNLHPEIQRRLFNKIYDFAVENKKRIFITSHSHVAINCFYGKEETRIYHVTKDKNNNSHIETIDSDLSKGLILDDLGVKASDIFQSNGIVWVEGPSDRVYINKWLKLINPQLHEYEHYSFLYYGGKLLSHYSAYEENDMISILLTNRNSAIVMDSDIKNDGGVVGLTKQRIKEEFENKKLFSWVTAGREIENYIHKSVINKKYSNSVHEQINKYEDFKDYIFKDDPYFESHKVKTAESLLFEQSDLEVLDLKEKIVKLAETIERWNKSS